VASLVEVERAALAGAPAGTRLEVVIEPTGAAWLPIAVFFIPRGHSVFRVSSAKAADLRRFFSRHAKSNGIDADTLPLPLLAPGLRSAARTAGRVDRGSAPTGSQPGGAPSADQDLVRQLIGHPLTGDLGRPIWRC
jgi:hypothetical protein